ncbi:hypothetical protein JTE90_007461 [Oedothorax gibbosus]|uniref:Ion transport domain-containing protein n=1 Tax=Oedothorax gibbosus TaxID=931172 RepID=A0AAV6UA60_9ARAC|nr:hypothetical protein JTE90_007461 [Oedothorax gibbosus]
MKRRQHFKQHLKLSSTLYLSGVKDELRNTKSFVPASNNLLGSKTSASRDEKREGGAYGLTLFDTFLPVVLTLNVLLGPSNEWKLVTEENEMAFYVNYISYVMARTFLAMTFCIGFRMLSLKFACPNNCFRTVAVLTDLLSCVFAHVLPVGFVLAIIVMLGYAVMGFRFIYDVIVTGHGLSWIVRNMVFFIRNYERKEKKLELQSSYSDSRILHLYRKL